MRALDCFLGISCIVLALLDAFQTVILPRRPSGHLRLTRLFYGITWQPWRRIVPFIHGARNRETWLSIYGPLSLVLLIIMWALSLVLGFALCFKAAGSPFSDPLNPMRIGLMSDLYVSGTTLFTLGLGDVVPHTTLIRALLVLEAGMGLGFVALAIGYFPVLYGAFSRREVSISLLDARAGSPPTAAQLILRHAVSESDDELVSLLAEWERWAAELLESHISYPLLCYFRSQHTNQSWLGGLCAVLDTCALMIAVMQDLPGRQAQLTFAMARHAVVDLSQVFELDPRPLGTDRLSAEAFTLVHDTLCQAGVRVARDQGSRARLDELRALYEPYVSALSQFLLMDLPPFYIQKKRLDNWETVAQLRQATESAMLHAHEDTHIF